MITFTIILAIILVILLIVGFVVLVALAVGGVGAGVLIFLFSDIAIGIALTVFIIKAITKKK